MSEWEKTIMQKVKNTCISKSVLRVPPADQKHKVLWVLFIPLPRSFPVCLCTTAPPLVPACTAHVV